MKVVGEQPCSTLHFPLESHWMPTIKMQYALWAVEWEQGTAMEW